VGTAETLLLTTLLIGLIVALGVWFYRWYMRVYYPRSSFDYSQSTDLENPPSLETYYPNPENFSFEQRRFYEYWKDQWRNGNAIDVKGNVSYLFAYIYEVIRWEDNDRRISELEALLSAYPEEKIASYLPEWISDCYLEAGNLEMALAKLPPPPLGQTATHYGNKRLNLKLLVGGPMDADAHDVLSLFPNRLTRFGKEHIEIVAQFIDAKLLAWRNRKGKRLVEYFAELHSNRNKRKYPMYLFNGVPGVSPCYMESLKTIPFYAIPEFAKFAADVIRQSENAVREEWKIPRIGEGWIAETELYYKVKELFPELEVIHHASPDWLGRQHLDIYIPAARLAIEYQGPQHLQPVDYFGGEEAFERQKRRDLAKKAKCTKNGVKLIYVFEGYDWTELSQTLIEQVRFRIQGQEHILDI